MKNVPGPFFYKGEKQLSRRAKKTRKKVNILFRILLISITVILIILSSKAFNKLMKKKFYKKEYSEYVSKYAEEYDVDENLIYALIKAESNFNAKAVSHQNAKGLMQLMQSTAQDLANRSQINLTKENILEPDININLGTQYISALLTKYDSIEVALAAYNAGSGNVDKWIKNGTIKADGSDIENIPYKETNTYVRKIMRDYKIYNELDDEHDS